MGDRANVYIKDRDSGVFLYTHWSGDKLPEIVQAAMIRGNNRWNDGQYLARIIFGEMIKENWDGETGYGISSTCGDGDDRILVIDCDHEKVYRGSFKEKNLVVQANKAPSQSFAEFITGTAKWPDF